MRTTKFFYCVNLRTLGLDDTRQHTAAEIKAAFLEKAKSTHPDTGGDAARFRQLKDAYDALRGKGGCVDGGATGKKQSYNDPYEEAAAHPTQQSNRSHIFTERYNDGDATLHSKKGTWDSGSGTRYANQSTRSCYRPYSSNYYDPNATGFTREEVARAELAMRLHELKRILWNCLIYGSALYLLYEYVPRRERPLSTDYQLGLDEREKARREGELRQMRPRLQPHWSDTEKARYLEEWNNRFRDLEFAGTGCRSSNANVRTFAQSGNKVSVKVRVASPNNPHDTLHKFPSPKTYCDVVDGNAEVDE